ncbi:MAG: SpoIIE family protein phosphatase [Phycisphaerales bacterium JB065]
MTSPTQFPTDPLRLTVLQGPDSTGQQWSLSGPAMSGRAEHAEIRLDNPRVSRRHAVFQPGPTGWTVRDHSSHGTLVNGIAIKADQPVPIRSGDRIGIGPFVLGVGARVPSMTLAVSAGELRKHSTISVTGREPDARAVSAGRLRMLFETAGTMRQAKTASELADAVLDRLLNMTGFEWGAVLDYSSDEASERAVITDRNRPGGCSVSASLLRAAQSGTASLLAEPDLRTSESIIGSRTQEAIASTICVGEEPVWQIYLASAGGLSNPDQEAAMLVDAMVQFAGLLLSDRQREDLAVRQSQFERDIEFARAVQKRLLGRASEAAGDGFAGMRSVPGRGVAGDLVGCRVSPSGMRYAFLGDVSGKGPGAAMLMAATQAYISSLIDHDLGIEALVPRLNAYIHQVSASSEFVTLWIGEFDPQEQRLRYTDAGHGYAFLLCNGEVSDLTQAGGPPVGVLADSGYAIAEVHTPAGCCMLLCSDGVVEQQNSEGEQFGRTALRDLLASTPIRGIEAAIMDRLTAHAGSTHYSDDVTLATIEF